MRGSRAGSRIGSGKGTARTTRPFCVSETAPAGCPRAPTHVRRGKAFPPPHNPGIPEDPATGKCRWRSVGFSWTSRLCTTPRARVRALGTLSGVRGHVDVAKQVIDQLRLVFPELSLPGLDIRLAQAWFMASADADLGSALTGFTTSLERPVVTSLASSGSGSEGGFSGGGGGGGGGGAGEEAAARTSIW